MVQRFGSREICDVTFKALNDMKVGKKTIKKGQVAFVIDTAQTSNMEQATTVVYAQGGRGYNRLIAWEGEKTMTFNVTDALMSPIGLKILTDAGLIEAGIASGSDKNVKPIHVHTTVDAEVGTGGVINVGLSTLIEELGLPLDTTSVSICTDPVAKVYGIVLDNNGGIKNWIDSIVTTESGGTTTTVDSITVTTATATGDTAATSAVFTINSALVGSGKDVQVGDIVKLDFYVVMTTGATQITIEPSSFGGYFYVEADTLYRNEDGKDMAATLTFPKVKINSAFTITMAANGDPSTFDFQMDAMPGYNIFDRTKKVVCDIAIVGGFTEGSEATSHAAVHSTETPVMGE